MYAYHPTDDTVTSVDECLGSGKVQDKWKILNAKDIVDGFDELGVLIYGH
jgi:homospermidine synthase